VRFVITVQALKEGWDCPWAYALFSVAELGSSRAVEQILGRVLRMPRAQRKQRADLNSAYAFVASTQFSEAAQALKDGLVAAGFERQDVEDLVVDRGMLPGLSPSAVTYAAQPVTVVLQDRPEAPVPLDLVQAVSWNATTGELVVREPLTASQEKAVLQWAGTEAARATVQAALSGQTRPAGGAVEKSPAERGVTFAVPVLAWQQGDFLHVFEEDIILEHNAWTLADCDADLPGFVIPNTDHGIVIDISGDERIQQRFLTATDRQLELLQTSTAWPAERLINEIDRSFAHPGLTDAEMVIWLTRVVAGLERAGHTLEKLTAHRHRLFRAVAARVAELEKASRKQTFETLLFGEAAGAVHVSLASVFTFHPDKYPVGDRYRGLDLPRHYYREIGAMNGEEADCARLLAHDPRVETWVRNLEREPMLSFWIQTSTDKFYPDFVAKLTNGKLLVVEYKGGILATNDDTREKERLGKLWETRSGGWCFFEMVKGPGELRKLQDAITRAVG
jgi:type III restriction enzyme